MNNDLSIGNDQSTSIDFGDDAAIDPFANTAVSLGETSANRVDADADLQSIIDQVAGQRSLADIAPNVLSASSTVSVAEDTIGDPLTSLPEGFEARANALSDIGLEGEIRNRELQLLERRDQKRLAEQTADNSDAIANGLGLIAGLAGLGGSIKRGIASVAAGFGISLSASNVIEGVTNNSAGVAAKEITRLEAELQALNNVQRQRENAPPPLPGGPEVTIPIPDQPEAAATLPEEIADQREIASTEREKQAQFENIAKTDPEFRDQALKEAGKAAERAQAAETRANELQTEQDERVNALAAAEEEAAKVAAEQAREQQRREQADRSEPNGDKVDGADRGVSRNEVPDSF
ncbi:MAG: hypothetical protein ACR2RD_11205 [Woeseiaceae bacterium]